MISQNCKKKQSFYNLIKFNREKNLLNEVNFSQEFLVSGKGILFSLFC